MQSNIETDKFVRPTLSFETITFSDGQTLQFDSDEIIVFVGPNNAGKSAALRELNSFVSRSQPQLVIKNASLRKTGTSEDLRSYLEQKAQKAGDPANFSYAGMGYNIHHSHVHYFDQQTDRHPVAPFFSALLATETRISGSNAAGAISLFRDPPSHPIHLMMMDNGLAENISRLFRRAFRNDLIVFRAGGSQFPLYVGERPVVDPGSDELGKGFIDRLLAACIPLQSQGDGMRSFATVMLHVLLTANHSIQFLDEPEAFLHPPQARLLGEYIASERQSDTQLFIATHSTDILDGLLSSGDKKVRIIRIQRDGNLNRIKELSKERTASIANDTLTRYSGVFKGIFYERVFITESDSDCMFYSSILNTRSVVGEEQPDVLFIHASGKHRMAKLATTLRSLDVPVTVIADFDILSEENAFRGLIESLGGDWDDIEHHWKVIKNGVEATRPPLNAAQVKTMIASEIETVSGINEFPKSTERNIKRIFRSVSPWDSVKQAGKGALSTGPVSINYNHLEDKCSRFGLWIVPVGELEGFCKATQASHGPAFVEKILEERDLENDSELKSARDFMSAVWVATKT